MHDLRRLRAFHEVAERRSFSAAALALGYAQSVVSHHVAALEGELGLALVDRSSRPIALTAAGHRIRQHAVAILGRVAEAEDDARALAGLAAGRLRLAAFHSAWTSFVPRVLAEFERKHTVTVDLERLEPTDALRRLRAGDVDLAVVYVHGDELPAQATEPRIASARLGVDPFRLVLPAAHPLARKRPLRVSNLERERFAAPPQEEGSTYHAMLDDLCAEGGFRANVAYTVPDVMISRELVAAGLCISIMAELTIPAARDGIAIRPLPGQSRPHRTIFATWLPNRHNPAVAPMVELLIDAAADRLPRATRVEPRGRQARPTYAGRSPRRR